MIAQGSYKILLPFFLAAIIISIFYWYVGLVILGFTMYLLWFFRDPERTILADETAFLAAADGTVQYISEEQDCLKVAIRMSPFDVHINRSPIRGTVRSVEYRPGKHQSVYFAGAELKNEQNLIMLENDKYQVDILQITGSFARRIECWVEVNDTVKQGEKIGMIRFGSQTNIVIMCKDEKKHIRPLVREGDSVRAGLTIIAQEQVSRS